MFSACLHRPYVYTLLTLAFLGTPFVAAQQPKDQPKSREFLFTYGATITKLKPGQTARIWIPIAPSTEHQEVKVVSTKLSGSIKETQEPEYGNEFFYVEAKAGEDGTIPLEVTYRVKRHEVLGDQKSKADKVDQRFLKPDALVPLEGKQIDLIKDKKLPDDQVQLGKLLYDVVNEHMVYNKKGTGWGRGDVLWACDSKYGNCTDFHSLFISLSRAKKVPAKFEMGFSVPEKRGTGEIGGYHCWAFFKPENRGWLPVDISEANRAKETNPKMVDYYFGNLTQDRVQFTTGRDINLVPKQAGGPVNFIIYPYVEVDGQPYAMENITRKFSYQDVQ